MRGVPVPAGLPFLKRPVSLVALALLLGGLGGCARQTDTFKPRITVTSPAGGNVTSQTSFLVEGYVMDDTGVTDITVDGTSIPIQEGSRKLARFAFKTLVQGERGQYTIVARDAAGNAGKLVLPVTVDPQRPVIRVTRFERSGNVVRVGGVVTDNRRVTQVIVDGTRLNIAPGPRVEFYAETTGIWADIEAQDAAGNRATLRAR